MNEMTPSMQQDALLWTLEEISRLVSNSGNPTETLTNIVELIQRRFESDVCSVYLLEPDRSTLVLAATVGLRPESVGRVRMRLSEGLAGLVGEQLRPQVVEDATRHPRFKYFKEAGEDPYHSFLGVPVVDRGLHAVGAGGVGDRSGVVELCGGKLVERVGDVEVRRLPVGADRGGLRSEWVGDAGDGRALGEGCAGLVDGCVVGGVVEAALVGVEHDAGGLAALAREAVVQDVGGVLGLDAGHPLAVVELAAGRALQRDDGDGGHEPEPSTRNGCRALLRPRRYRNALTGSSWVGPRTLRDTSTIPEGADLLPRCR